MTYNDIPQEVLNILFIISLIELVLKGFALFRAAKNNQKKWFISILVLNTLGLLPLFYLLFVPKKYVN